MLNRKLNIDDYKLIMRALHNEIELGNTLTEIDEIIAGIPHRKKTFYYHIYENATANGIDENVISELLSTYDYLVIEVCVELIIAINKDLLPFDVIYDFIENMDNNSTINALDFMCTILRKCGYECRAVSPAIINEVMTNTIRFESMPIILLCISAKYLGCDIDILLDDTYVEYNEIHESLMEFSINYKPSLDMLYNMSLYYFKNETNISSFIYLVNMIYNRFTAEIGELMKHLITPDFILIAQQDPTNYINISAVHNFCEWYIETLYSYYCYGNTENLDKVNFFLRSIFYYSNVPEADVNLQRLKLGKRKRKNNKKS